MPSDPFDTASHDDLKLMQGFPPPPERRVTLANGLWDAPYNRWSYQNMRRIWPTAPIRCADRPVALPRRIDEGIGGVRVAREDGTQAEFDDFLRQTFTDSFVVIHGGAVVYERYLNGMTPAQPHIMFSCTKSFVGLQALMAVRDGLISEDTRIADVVPEADNGGAFAGATLGQVLDMTNAMEFSEDYADQTAGIHEYSRVIGSDPKDPSAHETLYDFLLSLPRDAGLSHDEVFIYQTPKTDMINWVVNRLTGRDFVTAMEGTFWSKLGTDGEAYILLDPAGTVVAGGGLCATPQDIARFAAMMLANGHFDGAQLVPSEIIDEISKGGSREAFLKGPDAEGEMADGHWSYRAHWWVRNTPGKAAIMALGIYGQWIYIDREHDIAVIKQSSQPEADTPYFNAYTLRGIDAVVAHLAHGAA